MKNYTSLVKSIFFFFAFFLSNVSNAQLCIPDPSYTLPGVYPDTTVNLNTGCAGAFYHQDFTLVVPVDTTVFGFTFTIDFMQIDSVGGLPAGMSFVCNPGTCNFPGGTSGCFQIYGIAPPGGIYDLIFYIEGQAFHPIFGTVSFPYQYPGYKLRVGSFPVLTTGNTSATCNGSNAMAWVNATGSNGNTFLWNTSSTNDSIFSLSAGIYNVAVSDTFNCTTLDTLIVNDLGAPQIDTILATMVLCYAGLTGSATAIVSGGTPGYSYLWSNGDTTITSTNLSMGVYSLAVTDTNNCQTSSIVSITEPPQLFAFQNHTDVSCNGSNDGTAMVTVVGGVGSYGYNWSNGDLIASASLLTAATYTVTVTDGNGCTITTTTVISEPPLLVLNMGVTDASCFGGADGSANVVPTGGTPTYSYLWNNGDTTSIISNVSAGMYVVTVTDSLGCNDLDSMAVSSPTAISINLTGTNESMLGMLDGSINSTVSGGVLTYTYLWSNGDTVQNISNLAGGTYTLTVTDGNGCISTDTITIQTLPGFGLEGFTNTLSVYPNPTSGYFFIDITEEGLMSLNDLYGNTLLSRNMLSGKQLVQLPVLPAGVYFLYFSSNNQHRAVKLILQ